MRYLLLLLFLFSCTEKSDTQNTTPKEEIKEVQSIGTVWATLYFVKKINEDKNGVKILDINNKEIGPRISNKDFCNAAIEGTFTVNNETFNYIKSQTPAVASCGNSARNNARWFKTKSKFGVGNKSNVLIPFVSIACDQGNFSNSIKWVNNGYMPFGTKIFIPAAKGIVLPSGELHDGFFICHDIGTKILGNHIDIFIGHALNDSDANKINPFPFVKSSALHTTDAYIVR